MIARREGGRSAEQPRKIGHSHPGP